MSSRRGMILAIGKHDRVLVQRDRFLIGRSSGVDLFLSDQLISRRHAELARVGDTWTIRDVFSTSGVDVDGVRVGRDPYPVALGARIVMGPFEFRVVALAGEVEPDAIIGPYQRGIRFACSAIACEIDVRLSAPTASAERFADLDDDLARGASMVRDVDAMTVVEFADPLSVVAAAQRLCTRVWPDLGGAPITTQVGDYTLDAHALARLELRDAAVAWSWLCRRTYLRTATRRPARCVALEAHLLSEGRLEPTPAMLAAARACGDGLLVWISDNSGAQLARVRGPTTIRSSFSSDQVDEIELPAALPSLASGTVAYAGHLGLTQLTVA